MYRRIQALMAIVTQLLSCIKAANILSVVKGSVVHFFYPCKHLQCLIFVYIKFEGNDLYMFDIFLCQFIYKELTHVIYLKSKLFTIYYLSVETSTQPAAN